ncbi:MAG TPA: hypothetical protein VJ483_06075 [Holophagaceae bacterium]|nr:hypothetical protein [Holophagaceae bacterium]
MRSLILALAALSLAAQGAHHRKAAGKEAPLPGAYKPDPKLWKLFVLNPMGGWTTAKEADLGLKVVDPKDPKPPKEGRAVPVDEDLATGEEDDADAYYEGLKRGDGESWEAFSKRLDVERKKNAWRDRKLEVWFNGVKEVHDLRVGHPLRLHFELQDGENRVEVRQPDSGRYAVRSLFAMNTRDRLIVRLSSPDAMPTGYYWGWWSGGLQVVEPDNTESIGGEPTPSGGKNQGTSYVHPAPLPGTYTVRWFDPRSGVDGYGYDAWYENSDVKPQRVVAEVILDTGTDREKRWRFERLVVPGTKRVTMGSFDVED